MIKAVVGAGGKTSLVHKLAEEYRRQGKKVFVTTSTHMLIEEDTVVSGDTDEIIEVLEKTGYVMAGTSEGRKISTLPVDVYEKICPYADVVLIEADGSRQLPFKFPNDTEPVIYDNVDEIIIVAGLHGLGEQAKDVVHRLELAKKHISISDQQIMTPVEVQELIKVGYQERLSREYPNKKLSIKITHNDSLYQKVIAKMLEEKIDVSLIKEEWFEPQPELIICGAGHVARELAKIASCLDFHIKVIDDREEFANKDNIPWADEVICDSFEHLEKHLDNHGYYVVVTRGHQADFECVNTIMKYSYQYLGMIGSKKKVAASVELLRQAGISEEKIATLHAPIGLDIKANTPAEIAISILAEIIMEKNKKCSSFVSRELLNVPEKGTLCIIVEKKGSAPRGTGSMMFVTENRTIDSIGGGPVEAAAIRDARNTEGVVVRDYHLNNTESAELGMICGGSNKVLFIPIK